MDFKVELKNRVKEVDNIIKTYLPKEKGYQKTVIEAMNYSVKAGGKRLRPIFMKETFELLSKDKNKNKQALEAFMSAMELAHTFSLVHDDLPEMDNDLLRRGKATTHAKYGQAMGVLAGDGLLNYAYEVAFTAFDNEENDPKCVAKALKVFSNKLGISGMLGGQVVDVEATEKNLEIDKKKLDFIYKLKTGALIEASMVVGAIFAGADDETIDKVEKIALDIGVAFQIQDDVLDVISSDEVLGKPVNSDEKNNKITYTTLYGVEEAKKFVKKYSDRAFKNIKSLDGDNPFLSELIISLISREK